MFSENEILSRLQNGENIEAIAQEMTDAINKANAAFTKSQEVEERAADLQVILDELHDWCQDYMATDAKSSQSIAELFETLDADTVLDMIALFQEYYKQTQALQDLLLSKYSGDLIPPKAKDECKCDKSPDAAINDFLHKFGLS